MTTIDEKAKVKDIILEELGDNFKTGVELVSKVTARCFKVAHFAELNSDSVSKLILDTLENMVKEGSIIELEYILPSISYRVKSLYFPKGTAFMNYEPCQ